MVWRIKWWLGINIGLFTRILLLLTDDIFKLLSIYLSILCVLLVSVIGKQGVPTI